MEGITQMQTNEPPADLKHRLQEKQEFRESIKKAGVWYGRLGDALSTDKDFGPDNPQTKIAQAIHQLISNDGGTFLKPAEVSQAALLQSLDSMMENPGTLLEITINTMRPTRQ